MRQSNWYVALLQAWALLQIISLKCSFPQLQSWDLISCFQIIISLLTSLHSIEDVMPCQIAKPLLLFSSGGIEVQNGVISLPFSSNYPLLCIISLTLEKPLRFQWMIRSIPHYNLSLLPKATNLFICFKPNQLYQLIISTIGNIYSAPHYQKIDNIPRVTIHLWNSAIYCNLPILRDSLDFKANCTKITLKVIIIFLFPYPALTQEKYLNFFSFLPVLHCIVGTVWWEIW